MEDDEYAKKIDRVRKTGSFKIGERKLLDDLYEASQEGAPLREEIESMQEEIPVAETAADLRELIKTEPDVLFAMVEAAFPKADSVPIVEEIEKMGPGRFCVSFGVGGRSEPTVIFVDGCGRLLGAPDPAKT